MPRKSSKKLTVEFVRKVKPPATGRDEYFDALLPGHAEIVLDGGKAHVRQARDTIDKLDVPPNWFV